MEFSEVRKKLKKYAHSDPKKVFFQIINTFVPYLILQILLMFLANKGVNFFYLLPLTLITASFMVRVFILFHDCTHGSFLRTSKWNTIWGNIFAPFVFTPFIPWKTEHNAHHATVGNLDRRGVGDIWTLTVDEYLQSSRIKRFIYNIYRHPLFLFGIAPAFLFIILNRIPNFRAGKKQIWSTIFTNFLMVLVGLTYSLLFSFQVYVIYQILIIAIATSMGVWLFYIQHQFEDVYWRTTDSWGITEAAVTGSSFYKLPAVLEWISGYIGYHHIHHLNARIPNYHLKASHREVKLEGITTITLKKSFQLLSLKFYHEKEKRLITRKELKSYLKEVS